MSAVRASFLVVVTFLLTMAGSVGCTGHTIGAPLQVRTPAEHADDLTRAFAPGASILSGVDPSNGSAEWRPGDQVLYGLRLLDGESETIRFVRIELLLSDLAPDACVDVCTERASNCDATAIGDAIRLTAPTEGRPPSGFERVTPAKWDYKTSFRDETGKQRQISIDSRSALFRLWVYDDRGALLETHYTFGPETYLRDGLVEYIGLAKPALERLPAGSKLPRSKFTDEELSRLLRGGVSVFAIGRVLWFTPELLPIIKRMIAMPSIWSVVVNLGVKFSTEIRVLEESDATAELPGITDRGGARQMPFVIRMNDQPALLLKLTALPPKPPMHLCGGVVAMEASHLNHAERRLSARLLAARRAR